MRVRLLVAAGVVVLGAAAAMLSLQWWDHAKKFPGSLSGARTNVSAVRTLHDHAVRLPPTASGFRYSSANGDGYPLFAYFADSCAHAEPFASQNGFHPASQLDVESELVSFATGQGWDARHDTHWYRRSRTSQRDGADAMVEGIGPGMCRFYILSDEGMG
jgi:hypothetical protein